MNAARKVVARFAWLLFVSHSSGVICASQEPTRPVEIFAGTGSAGFAEGPATNAQFSADITGLGSAGDGSLYVADAGNRRLRRVLPSGEVQTLAGNGTNGSADGPGAEAQFSALGRLALDSLGNCYVLDADQSRQKIRRVTSAGEVSTFYSEAGGLRFTSIAVRHGDEVLLTEGAPHASPYDPTTRLSTISSAGVKTVLVTECWCGTVMEEINEAAGGGLSNVYWAATTLRSVFPQSEVQVLFPTGQRRTLLTYQSYYYGEEHQAGGLAVHASGKLFFFHSYKDRWTAQVTVTIESLLPYVSFPVVFRRSLAAAPGLRAVLAVDDAENVYVVQGARILRVLNYPGLALIGQTAGGGTVSVDPLGPYFSNAVARITASPLPGWTFLNWSGDAQGTSPEVILTMDRTKTVNAVFGAPLPVEAGGGGAIARQPDLPLYPFGSTVRAEAQPKSGFAFTRWSDGMTYNPRDVTLTNLAVLRAEFTELPKFTLTTAVLGEVGGSVVREPPGDSYYRGTAVIVTAVPAPGYRFQTWLDNVLANPRTVSVSSNVVLFAVFVPGQAVPPTISGPSDAAVLAGNPVRFDVSVQGTPPLSYRWQHNGKDIAGATDPSYTIPSARLADAGAYRVIVTNAAGSATSRPAALVVWLPPPRFDLASLRFDPNSGFHFAIGFEVQQVLLVEASTDLVNWIMLPNIPPAVGPLEATDAPATNLSRRYYRAVSP